MLSDLITGIAPSSIILLKDNVDCICISNEHVLYNFIIGQSKRYDKVVVLCYEKSPDVFKNILPQDIQDRVVILDGTKFINTWLDFHDNKNSSCTENITDLIREHVGEGLGQIGIIIDSLSFHLLLHPPSYTCQYIHNLSTSTISGFEVKQLVCGVHEDVFDSNILKLVEHTATSVLTITPSKHPSYTCTCHSVHHKTSGKVLRKTEDFNINKDKIIYGITEIKQSIVAIETSDSQSDPTQNLTFNLSLKESEKEAREQLVLPFTYDKNRKDAVLNQPGSGQIFYEADEVDDLDEEDPDDDLNI